MVQYRRLDPLANASPYERLKKSPVKSFSLTAGQYDRVTERQPELVVPFGAAVVIGVPHRDYLELNYAFPEVEFFRDHFVEMTQAVLDAASKEQSPRGTRLVFRDAPNRALAEMLFWPLLMQEESQWIEMNYIAPEQEPPGDELAGGFAVREATEGDRDAVATIEAAVTGLDRLTDGGVTSIYENASWLRLVTDASGKAVACVTLRTEPGSWGVIDELLILPEVAEALRGPLTDWCIAFLRNNGGRRVRRLTGIDERAELALLRSRGFTPGDTGINYLRPADAEEVRARMDERRAHGSLITFGDWR
jgi:hypothetical protein